MTSSHEQKIQKKIKKLEARMKRRSSSRSESTLQLALRRFLRNKAGLLGLAIISVMFLIGFLATPFSVSVGWRGNTINLINWAGLTVYDPQTHWDVRIFSDPSAGNGSAVYTPAYQPPGVYEGWDVYKNPAEYRSLVHILGTNIGGQDLFSRVILGVRLTLLVAVGATLISLFIGIPIGMIAGFFGGKFDELLMRITDIFLTLPFYLVILLAVTVFTKNQEIENFLDKLQLTSDFIITAEVFGLGFFGWMGIARLVRAEILQIKNMDYVEAARALGANPRRILMRHIFPNILASLVIAVTYGMAINVVSEAAIAFILLKGSGVTSWGQELAEGLDFIQKAWWPVIFPGAAITIAVLGFNLLGDALRDAFDPRLR
jgi:peptide/nickel transport system permease protein